MNEWEELGEGTSGIEELKRRAKIPETIVLYVLDRRIGDDPRTGTGGERSTALVRLCEMPLGEALAQRIGHLNRPEGVPNPYKQVLLRQGGEWRLEFIGDHQTVAHLLAATVPSLVTIMDVIVTQQIDPDNRELHSSPGFEGPDRTLLNIYWYHLPSP